MQKTVEKRARILRAAVDVFGTVGFDAASMAEIAARAEVAKGTLYLYYASKEQLFEAAYQLCQQERLHACGVDAEGAMTVLERLCCRLRSGTRWELAEPQKNRLLRAYLTHPTFSRNVPRVVEGLNTQALEPVLEQGVAAGELRPLPVELLAEMYIRFGSAVFYYIEKHPADMDNEALWAQVFRSLQGCLGA